MTIFKTVVTLFTLGVIVYNIGTGVQGGEISHSEARIFALMLTLIGLMFSPRTTK